MPIFVQWDNPEKTIIYIRYECWTWNDYYDALHKSIVLAKTVDHPVDIIADLADGLVPKGGTISHTAAALKQHNERVGVIVLVTPNRFIQSLTQMSARVLPNFTKKYRMTSTVQLARELIAREREKRMGASQQ